MFEKNAQVKVIEEGAFVARVDASDIDNVKIEITMRAPLYVSDYREDMDVWHWEAEIAKEIAYLRSEVNSYIHRAWKERRGRLYAL
jgi:hypothetical protein